MHPTAQILLSIHLAFVAYLLFQGRGLKRVLHFELVALGVTAGAMLLFLPLALFRLEIYLPSVFYLSLFILPFVMFTLDRGDALQRVSILEVVLINVLAVVMVQPSGVLSLLLNPLRLDGVAGTLFGLWPSLLALLLVARGPPGDLRLRLVLGLWTHVVGIVWLLPVAFASIMSFDASSGWAYLESLIASLAAVHVALVAHGVLLVMHGNRVESGHGFATPAQALAENVYLTRWNPLVLTAAGAVWWIVVAGWLKVAPDGVSTIGVPYVAAFVIGSLLMPHRHDEQEDADLAHRPTPVTWRSYRLTFIFSLIGVGVVWLVDAFENEFTLLITHFSFWIVLAVFAVGALLLINGLLAALWVLADAAGRPVGAAGRRLTWLAVLGIVAAFKFVTLPLPHPEGGLDGHEERFAHGRVYVWYAGEIGPLYRQGRAVYFEEAGIVRNRVCGTTDDPVDGFRIEPDKGIECRWPDRVQLVDTLGYNTQGPSISRVPLPVTEITAEQAGCRVVAAAEATVRCRDVDYPLGVERHVPGLLDPSSLDVAAARYFRFEHRHMTLTDCIEVPADALLPDGTTSGAMAIILIRHAHEARPFWLTDREGSCARVYGSGDSYAGDIYYQWHEQIAPLHGLTRSPLNLDRLL